VQKRKKKEKYSLHFEGWKMNEQIKRQGEQREGQSNWNEGKRERERENKVWKGKKMKRLGSSFSFLKRAETCTLLTHTFNWDCWVAP